MHRVILANVDLFTRAEGFAKSGSRALWESLAVLGGAILIFLILLAWARYLRGGGRRRRVAGGEKVYRDRAAAPTATATPPENSTEDDDAESAERRRYKRRVRRRDHRARNPTLAEVGGLPPSPNGEAHADPS